MPHKLGLTPEEQSVLSSTLKNELQTCQSAKKLRNVTPAEKRGYTRRQEVIIDLMVKLEV